MFLKCSVYNARSVRNKTMEINYAILPSQSQLITITESWIQTNENDDFFINEGLPENCFPLSFLREFSTGGGIPLIHRKDISIPVIQNLGNQTSKLLLVEYFP